MITIIIIIIIMRHKCKIHGRESHLLALFLFLFLCMYVCMYVCIYF